MDGIYENENKYKNLAHTHTHFYSSEWMNKKINWMKERKIEVYVSHWSDGNIQIGIRI